MYITGSRFGQPAESKYRQNHGGYRKKKRIFFFVYPFLCIAMRFKAGLFKELCGEGIRSREVTEHKGTLSGKDKSIKQHIS